MSPSICSAAPDKENTTIVDGAGKKSEISGRIAQIKLQIEDTTSDYYRDTGAARQALWR